MFKISIITVVKNRVENIEDAIKSVLNQVNVDIEFIIIDGVSTDGTLEIIKSYKDQLAYMISEPDSGIYDAMNKGISLASGHIVGMLNSDDLYFDDHVLEKVVNTFESTKIECLHAELFYVDKNNINKIVRHWRTHDYSPGIFKTGWHPAHPTFFVKREIYEKYGLFNLNFRLAADFELMLRFLERYKITSAYLPEPIVRMRLGGATSKSIKNIIRQNVECYKAFEINGIKISPIYPLFRLIPKLKQFFHE